MRRHLPAAVLAIPIALTALASPDGAGSPVGCVADAWRGEDVLRSVGDCAGTGADIAEHRRN